MAGRCIEAYEYKATQSRRIPGLEQVRRRRRQSPHYRRQGDLCTLYGSRLLSSMPGASLPAQGWAGEFRIRRLSRMRNLSCDVQRGWGHKLELSARYFWSDLPHELGPDLWH